MWETRVDVFVSAVALADVFVTTVLYTCVCVDNARYHDSLYVFACAYMYTFSCMCDCMSTCTHVCPK